MNENIFDMPLSTLRRWGPRQPIDHRKLNEPVDRLNRIASGVQQPTQKPSVARGKTANSKASLPRQFRLKEVQVDTLRCVAWDGTTEGSKDVTILRPYLLQRTVFDRKQRDGEWFDYSGFKVTPTFTVITYPEGYPLAGQPIILYPEDHVTRMAFRFGHGRDVNGDPIIEWAVERVLPAYFAGYDPDDPDAPPEGFAGINHAAGDIILAMPINEQTVGVETAQWLGQPVGIVAASWIEITDRQWYVVARTEHNASPDRL